MHGGVLALSGTWQRPAVTSGPGWLAALLQDGTTVLHLGEGKAVVKAPVVVQLMEDGEWAGLSQGLGAACGRCSVLLVHVPCSLPRQLMAQEPLAVCAV